MNIFRYRVFCDSILYKRVEPLIDSGTAGFFIDEEEFDLKYLPFKKEDYYWLKFNRERDNTNIYAPFRDNNDIYNIKLIIDYAEYNFSIENKINLLNIQLNNSINFLEGKFNNSDTNPFYLNKDTERTSNNLIQLSLKSNNYIEINLNPNNDLSNNEINYLKDIISNYFLEYKQKYSFLAKKIHNKRGRLPKYSEETIEHSKLEFDNIKDRIKTFCLNYIFKKIEEELKNKSGLIKLSKIKQEGKRKVSNDYYYNFIIQTFKSIFIQKVKFICKDENNNINLIDEIYERKNEYKEIIDFFNMKYIYFFENLKTYLKSEVTEEGNKKDWEKLKENLEKSDNTNNINNKEIIDNNKILLSLITNFRQSINEYIKKYNEEYKKFFILSFEEFFKKLKPRENHSENKKKEKSKFLPKFYIK